MKAKKPANNIRKKSVARMKRVPKTKKATHFSRPGKEAGMLWAKLRKYELNDQEIKVLLSATKPVQLKRSGKIFWNIKTNRPAVKKILTEFSYVERELIVMDVQKLRLLQQGIILGFGQKIRRKTYTRRREG